MMKGGLSVRTMIEYDYSARAGALQPIQEENRCLSMNKRNNRIITMGLITLFILSILLYLRSHVFPFDIKEPEGFRDQAFLVLIGATVASAVFVLTSFERSRVLNLIVALSFSPIVLLYFSSIEYEIIRRLSLIPLTVSVVVMLVKRWTDKRAAAPTVLTTINEPRPATSGQKWQWVSVLRMDERKKRIIVAGAIAIQALILIFLYRSSYLSLSDIREPGNVSRDQAFLVLIGFTVISAVLILVSFERSRVLNLCIALPFCLIALLYFSDIGYVTIEALLIVPLTICPVVLLVKRRAEKRAVKLATLTAIIEASPVASEQKGQGASDEEDVDVQSMVQ